MLGIVDRRLGISSFMDELDKTEMHIQRSREANPETGMHQKAYMTPRVMSRRNSEQSGHSQVLPEAGKEGEVKRLPEPVSRGGGDSFKPEGSSLADNRKYYMSYDVVSGRNRYYGNDP